MTAEHVSTPREDSLAAPCRKRRLAGFLCWMVLLSANIVQAQQAIPFDKDFEEKSWDELRPLLPGFPKETNLKQIDIGPVTSFRFFVDTESVNVGTDGVVRFALVARSDRGSSNVSYEGLNCQAMEKKIYAIGRPEGDWVAVRNARWTRLERQKVNAALTVLYEDFFCPQNFIVSSTAEAVEALKKGGHPRGRSSRR